MLEIVPQGTNRSINQTMDWHCFLPWSPSGFTTMSKEVEASTVMTFLNQLFTLFDRICEECGVHKLETAG